MKKLFKHKLFNSMLIFTLSSVFNKGLNFFILPVLTYYLTKEDYGMLGLITSVTTIAVVYIGFFPANFLMVKSSLFGKEKMSKYMSNILIMIGVTFFAVLGILLLGKDIIFSNYSENFSLVIYITLLCLFQVFWWILTTIIQLEKDAVKYAIIQFVQTIITIGIALLLIIHFSWGWKGKFFAELTIYFIFSFYTIYYIIKADYIKFDFDMLKIKELTSYLFPLTFFVLGLFIMGTVDKIFIANMISIEAAGIYAVAITMTIIINIVFDSVIRAWEPYLYESLNENTFASKVKVVKVTYLYTAFTISFIALYIAIVPFIFHIMINEKFNDALLYIPILVIGYGFEGLRKAISGMLNHLNKVKINAIITSIAAVLNIILNIILIEKYGVYGAAYATTISFASLYLMTIFFVTRYVDLPWTLKEKVC